MPIPLVDGAMQTVRLLEPQEFYSLLDEVEEWYGHPPDLDGVQSPQGDDYGGDYFDRWMQEFTDWHVGHARNLRNRTLCESVIDVGCGMGNIVRGFKRIGVDAYGLDISRYVVDHCDPEIQGRVLWGDLSRAETLPWRKYDLVIGYDMFEHIPDPVTVVRNVCGLSGRWLHVKVPDIRGLDAEESRRFDSTHITGRSIGWWIREFERNGFTLIFDEGYTKLKWDPEYALGPTGAPDLHGLFRRRIAYVG